MYACYGDRWANLYQWAPVRGDLQGTLTIVLADGEAPLLADRTQVFPMTVDISDNRATLLINGRPTIAAIGEAVLTVQISTRDGRISRGDCPAVSIDDWNQIVDWVRR